MTNSMHIKIVLNVNGQTYTAEHKGPVILGGDRRKWRQRLVDHVLEHVGFMTDRFNPAAELLAEAAVTEPPAAASA